MKNKKRILAVICMVALMITSVQMTMSADDEFLTCINTDFSSHEVGAYAATTGEFWSVDPGHFFINQENDNKYLEARATADGNTYALLGEMSSHMCYGDLNGIMSLKFRAKPSVTSGTFGEFKLKIDGTNSYISLLSFANGNVTVGNGTFPYGDVNEWHDFEVRVIKTCNTYMLLIDGKYVYSQWDKNLGSIVFSGTNMNNYRGGRLQIQFNNKDANAEAVFLIDDIVFGNTYTPASSSFNGGINMVLADDGSTRLSCEPVIPFLFNDAIDTVILNDYAKVSKDGVQLDKSEYRIVPKYVNKYGAQFATGFDLEFTDILEPGAMYTIYLGDICRDVYCRSLRSSAKKTFSFTASNDVNVGDITVTGTDGDKIGAGAMTASVEVSNYSDEIDEFKPVLVAALYKDNALKTFVVKQSMGLANGESETLTCNIDNSEIDADGLNVFVLNSLDDFKPLAANKTFAK